MTPLWVVFFHHLAFLTDSCDIIRVSGADLLLVTADIPKLAEISILDEDA